MNPVQPRSFTLESEGYGSYLYRRPILPKLGWVAGLFGMLLATITLLRA